MIRQSILGLSFSALLAGCATGDPAAPPTSPAVKAAAETEPVASPDDAADDPAIWVHPADPAQTLILGTDKQAGLHAYRLDGSSAQFLPAGRLNNVDVRQRVTIGSYTGDIAAASNRTDNTVVLFTIAADGLIAEAGRFAASIVEPYGLCLGRAAGELTVFVAYKSGEVVAYRLGSFSTATVAAHMKLGGQLEGCVFDDASQGLYIGEEGAGIWRIDYANGAPGTPALIDKVSSQTGLAADVEGLAIYATSETEGFLLASSQGNNLFTVYERQGVNAYVGRFTVANGGGSAGGVDGVAETDGIEATPAPLGPDFPRGVFIAQDGFNADAATGKPAPQNFKIIDWRTIEAALRESAAGDRTPAN